MCLIGALWNLWSEESKARFVETVSGHMSTCTDKKIIAKQNTLFREVSPELGDRIEKATGVKSVEGGVESMTFNGSHNGYGKKKAANGMKADLSEVVFNNGAPQTA
jgi:catalase